MKKLLVCFLFLVFIGLSSTYARDTAFHGALGVGGLFIPRQEAEFTQFAPELVGYSYIPVRSNALGAAIVLRPAVRFGYAWDQPETSRNIQISERDWKLSADMGIIYDWLLQPSLSFGFGTLLRTTHLYVSSDVSVQNSQVNGSTFLPFIYGQLGVGIPFAKSFVVIEPYTRFMHLFADARVNWTYGIELTFAIF